MNKNISSVDKSVENESYGKNQNDFLNWLQAKLEEEVGAVDRMYKQYKNFVIDHIKDLPSHYQYLLDNIYGGVDEHKLD